MSTGADEEQGKMMIRSVKPLFFANRKLVVGPRSRRLNLPLVNKHHFLLHLPDFPPALGKLLPSLLHKWLVASLVRQNL
jgi:hypothetical protein